MIVLNEIRHILSNWTSFTQVSVYCSSLRIFVLPPFTIVSLDKSSFFKDNKIVVLYLVASVR